MTSDAGNLNRRLRFGEVAALVWLYLARNFRVLTYFRVSFVTGLLSAACSVLIFLFLGTALAGQGEAGMPGGNYASFLIIGVVFNQFYGVALRSPYDAISRAYWSAQLESIILSPAPVRLVVTGEVLWSSLNSLIRVALYLVLGLAFGMSLQWRGEAVLPLLAAFCLGFCGAFGLGLASAAMFSLINAKGHSDPVQWGVSTVQSLVAGIYFPVGVLPGWLQAIASALPHTYALDAARRLLLPEYVGATLPVHNLSPVDPLVVDLVALAALALLCYWLGGRAFTAGMNQARRDGSLSRWS